MHLVAKQVKIMDVAATVNRNYLSLKIKIIVYGKEKKNAIEVGRIENNFTFATSKKR